MNFSSQLLNTGVNNPVYSWNFGPGATPSSATGQGTHTIIYTNGGGEKTISMTVSSAEGCAKQVSVTINDDCFGLPIKITRFTAVTIPGQQTVQLEWSCSQARLFRFFTVERSEDGINYTAVTNILYRENISSYGFTDLAGSASQLFYRLKLSDMDGQYSYSPVRKVILDQSGTVSVWPVPFTSAFFIRLNTSSITETFHCTLSDLNGRRIKMLNVVINRGSEDVEIKGLDAIPAGIYVLSIKGASKTAYLKLVKSK